MDYEYFKAEESGQFSFFRIPKALFTEKEFEALSTDAKLLYGILLDRISLSRQNGWIDANGHVYIMYTISELEKLLHISHSTISKLFKELDVRSGIGLIEKRRQGWNRPSIIYVKNFVKHAQGRSSRYYQSSRQDNGCMDIQNSDYWTSKKWITGHQESGLLDVKNLASNNTDINKTDIIYTEGSERTPAPEEKKFSSYGRFGNVYLSRDEYRELCEMYPYDCHTLIEQLSSYMKSRGTKYQNHFATLIRWAQKDRIPTSDGEDEYDKGEYL